MIRMVINKNKNMQEVEKEITEEEKEKAMTELTSVKNHFRTERIDKSFQDYKDHFHDERNPHQYERRTVIDRTSLDRNEVPFKKMLGTGGFLPVLVRECEARGIMLTTAEKKKVSIVKGKLMNDEGNKKSFKPKLPFDEFKWW